MSFVEGFGVKNVQCPIFKLKTSKILAQGQMVSVHRPHHTTLPYAESYLEPVFGFCPFKKGVGNVKCVIKVCLYFKRVVKELLDVEWVCEEGMSSTSESQKETPH